jgi:hypothetical protein
MLRCGVAGIRWGCEVYSLFDRGILLILLTALRAKPVVTVGPCARIDTNSSVVSTHRNSHH